MRGFILFVVICLSAWTELSAQVAVQIEPTDTTKEDRIIVDLADYAEYIVEGDVIIQKLMKDVRQVQLRQGNTFMYCDTAIIIGDEVTAYGNVIIQQGDSINVFADSLIYQGNTSVADLYGKVTLQKNEQQLFTDRLTYTLDEKKAVYNQGALLTNGGAQLTSRQGVFYVDQDLAYFSKEVVIVDTSFTLQSDTLEYDTNLEIATFHGPTLIQQKDGAKIYCEAGFYDIPAKQAEFRDRAQYIKDDQVATADIMNYDGELSEVLLRGNAKFKEPDKLASATVIRYDEKNEITYLEGNAKFENKDQKAVADTIQYDAKTEAFITSGRSSIVEGKQILLADNVDYDADSGFGIASGDVVWVDTVEQTTIYAAEAKYNKETEYVKSYGDRPMMVSMIESDSFYMASDTLLSYKTFDGEDSTRYFRAYHEVRFFKSDLQGTCDSVFFDGKDSIFQLIGHPILWSDSTQITADSVWIYLDSNTIDKIYFKQNALIVNTNDELFYNQVQGREMTAYFKDGAMETMYVNGNAESIYYAQDDSLAYIAVNKSLASKMKLTFEDGEISNIHFIKDPVSDVHPMGRIDHESIKLKGFTWQWDSRPTTVEDLRSEQPIAISSAIPLTPASGKPNNIEAKVDSKKNEKQKN